MTATPRQLEVISVAEEISLESSLDRLRDLSFMYDAADEVYTDTVTVLPDGTVLDTNTVVPAMEGLHILRSTVRWFQQSEDGVGSTELKKLGEVILTKPFLAVRSTGKRSNSRYMEVPEPQRPALPMNGRIREEDGAPMARSSREEVLRLYAFMALLFVLWIVWSKVTRCRVSGR